MNYPQTVSHNKHSEVAFAINFIKLIEKELRQCAIISNVQVTRRLDAK